MADQTEFNPVKLIISETVQDIMEERHILNEDIQKVIVHAEKTGNKMLSQETGHYLAYLKPVSVTYWVEYLPQEDGYIIFNTYSHRMEINEEVKA